MIGGVRVISSCVPTRSSVLLTMLCLVASLEGADLMLLGATSRPGRVVLGVARREGLVGPWEKIR